ncbi:hypothetical protein B0T22DRAFT_17637 [Podospora appendiculata]|uniref:Uncharacterized protein n=1 Tax=Podospora appendiculata TaxID=314037 RepID=A0AAE0XFT3_9PEZI|nr:hypothetical protein B0T22DRAFT_17637 [Podospora appendiculata]
MKQYPNPSATFQQYFAFQGPLDLWPFKVHHIYCEWTAYGLRETGQRFGAILKNCTLNRAERCQLRVHHPWKAQPRVFLEKHQNCHPMMGFPGHLVSISWVTGRSCTAVQATRAERGKTMRLGTSWFEGCTKQGRRGYHGAIQKPDTSVLVGTPYTWSKRAPKRVLVLLILNLDQMAFLLFCGEISMDNLYQY